jgi:hypothetical protein
MFSHIGSVNNRLGGFDCPPRAAACTLVGDARGT